MANPIYDFGVTARLSSFAAALSITLCAATLVALAFSYFRPVRPWNSETSTAYRLDRGVVSVGTLNRRTIDAPTVFSGRRPRRISSGVVTTYSPRFTIPLWPIVFGTAILPAYWLRQRLRRRPNPGLCPTCRYNLTGNTSGTCP